MRYYGSTKGHKKPPNGHPRTPPWRIALTANLKEDFTWEPGAPADAGSEFDGRDTVEAIAAALEAEGHWVHFCPADHRLPEALVNLRPHIVFNIAEGIQGDGREAQVPALCEMLGIPYTASRVLANALSLDKTQTKRVWASHGLPTPRFQEFRSASDDIDPRFTYPLFVKPAREGSGMGVNEGALVHEERELIERVAWVNQNYQQPALVEEYLPGREFTVGFIGNPGFPIHRRSPGLYDPDGYHIFPILEIDSQASATPGVYGHDAKSYAIGSEGAPGYHCPANLSKSMRARLADLAKKAGEAIGACDVSRVDIRLGADGRPYLLEINTLPGLMPDFSDLCIVAGTEGMPYNVLITEILYLAAQRFGLPFEVQGESQRLSAPAFAQSLARA